MTTQIRPTGKQASVGVRSLSEEEAFKAMASGQVKAKSTITDSQGGEANITHTRPGVVLMWKPGADGRFVPRTVSETAVDLNLANGWKIKCPDCGTNHEASGLPISDPNACPGRAPVAIRLCPIASCRKRIPDNLGFATADKSDDPNVLPDEAYTNSTPESRTRMQLNVHLWTRHPREAQMMNIPELPEAYRDMTQTMRPV